LLCCGVLFLAIGLSISLVLLFHYLPAILLNYIVVISQVVFLCAAFCSSPTPTDQTKLTVRISEFLYTVKILTLVGVIKLSRH